MVTLFCSAKLSKLLGVKNRLPSISTNNWNGHLFFLEGRKCLVFVHKETVYSFVLFDVLKKDLKNFREVFIKYFLLQLENDYDISEDVKEAVRTELADMELSTTDGDKPTIGIMNDCIMRLTWPREYTVATIPEIKKYVQFYYNENPTKTHKSPKQMMAEKLKLPFHFNGY